MNYEQVTPEENAFQTSKIKSNILLYTAVFFVAFSIYSTDSFSTWKFLAVFIPLAMSFIAWKRFWILLPVGFMIWFGVMLMSVGTIYNHDLLALTGPIVCPEGYRAEISTLVQNPVPGETYTSSTMRCVNDKGKFTNPGFLPHVILLGLYFSAALLLFIINQILFRLISGMLNNPYIVYLSGSFLYCYLARLIWVNKDLVIEFVKNIL